jgi:hypothetical protein
LSASPVQISWRLKNHEFFEDVIVVFMPITPLNSAKNVISDNHTFRLAVQIFDVAMGRRSAINLNEYTLSSSSSTRSINLQNDRKMLLNRRNSALQPFMQIDSSVCIYPTSFVGISGSSFEFALCGLQRKHPGAFFFHPLEVLVI